MLDTVRIDELVAWEEGTQSEEETVDMFQRLIDSGLAWQLQGMYGRTAMDLIESGHCKSPSNNGDDR